MEPEGSSGFKRNSVHQGIYSRPVERRPSKKSSSKDRHGMVYPDSFRDTGIRTVTPDSEAGNHSPSSEAEYLASSAAASPRPATRTRASDRESRRDYHSYHSAGDEEDTHVEMKSQRARSRTTTLDDQRSEISPNTFFRARNRLGSINTALA